MTTLQQTVSEMKTMADLLVKTTYPLSKFEIERDILILKQRIIVLDGYDVLVCYSKADHQSHFLESLQIQSSFSPFLPFVVVCKIGRAFLGNSHLCYVEFMKHRKKTYCWICKSKDNEMVPPEGQFETSIFEDFEYNILHPGSVDLF